MPKGRSGPSGFGAPFRSSIRRRSSQPRSLRGPPHSGGGRATILALITIAALFSACGGDDGDGSSANPTPGAGDNGEELLELQLAAENTQFDKDRLQAPSGSEVSLTLDNRDPVEHNFSLYETVNSNEPLFEGALLPGPSFLIYQFTAPELPGTYRFQCDIHPDSMSGDFIAE